MADLLDPTFLASLPRFVAPILLAALGGALCERAGVFNIAIEGFVLVGAFAAVAGSFWAGSSAAGLLAAVAAGVGMGLLFAAFSVRRPGDPIVVSLALNILAVGLTAYLLRTLFGVAGAFSDPGIAGLPGVPLPVLAGAPALGPLLDNQSPLFWLALALVPALAWGFRRHVLGLRIRAAGENPDGLRALGVDPAGPRAWALVLCGALCGLAGAQLSLSNVTLFVEGMSAGRGWVAVVAVLVSRGRPWPLLGIVALFGAVDSLSFRVQGLGWPQQVTEAMPYVASLLAIVAVSLWRGRPKESRA